jgi:hypothetical protein
MGRLTAFPFQHTHSGPPRSVDVWIHSGAGVYIMIISLLSSALLAFVALRPELAGAMGISPRTSPLDSRQGCGMTLVRVRAVGGRCVQHHPPFRGQGPTRSKAEGPHLTSSG